MTSPKVPLLARVQAWLAAQLGSYYAQAIQIVGRVFGVFVAAVVAKAISMGISISGLTSMAWWHAVLLAGVLAVIALVTGLLSTWLTGQPSIIGFFSSTIRSRRDFGQRVQHRVPVLVPRDSGVPNGSHEV